VIQKLCRSVGTGALVGGVGLSRGSIGAIIVWLIRLIGCLIEAHMHEFNNVITEAACYSRQELKVYLIKTCVLDHLRPVRDSILTT
jgi:hypothetical protein